MSSAGSWHVYKAVLFLSMLESRFELFALNTQVLAVTKLIFVSTFDCSVLVFEYFVLRMCMSSPCPCYPTIW